MMQTWLFIKPALYKQELMVTKWIFLAIPILFYSGVLFVQVIVLPKAINFFVAFEKNSNLKFMPKLSEYIGFCERFMVVFGIGFELPVLLLLMVIFNLINIATLKKHWRIVVFCICAVSAVITPPDALSMLALAIPLIVLYVATIVVIDYLNKRKIMQKGEAHA
jgi:sec-independent protein translocase protein TatC